jgi:catechol-2,3-dioxygenase
MHLPDAPIANEGFFVTHFLTVRDQEKSKDFYVRILGGKVIKARDPCYIKLANT